MIYKPSEQATEAEIGYQTLYNSVAHHLMEAMDAGSEVFASMLLCVLWGGFAGRYPEGHTMRSKTAFHQFVRGVTEEINHPDADEVLHDIPHVTPGWLPIPRENR